MVMSKVGRGGGGVSCSEYIPPFNNKFKAAICAIQ